MENTKSHASLSLDLDNQWSYMKTHGDPGWESFPSYLDTAVPRILDFLAERNLKITFFVVGQDAALEKNHAALKSLATAGHEIGNHSFNQCNTRPEGSWCIRCRFQRLYRLHCLLPLHTHEVKGTVAAEICR